MDRRMMYRRGGENYGPACRNTGRPNPVCGDIADRCPSEDMEYGGCDFENFPLAMCYVPWQRFRDLFENEYVALAHGTLFKELDLEFLGRSCK